MKRYLYKIEIVFRFNTITQHYQKKIYISSHNKKYLNTGKHKIIIQLENLQNKTTLKNLFIYI